MVNLLKKRKKDVVQSREGDDRVDNVSESSTLGDGTSPSTQHANVWITIVYVCRKSCLSARRARRPWIFVCAARDVPREMCRESGARTPTRPARLTRRGASLSLRFGFILCGDAKKMRLEWSEEKETFRPAQWGCHEILS